MDQNLQMILQLNQIPAGILERAIYQDIRELFLEKICSYMKSSKEHYLAIRRIYYQTPDDRLAAAKIVGKVCGGTLPDGDLDWLDRCIKAYFHKKPRRRPITEAERSFLWEKQRGCCAICGRPAALGSIHVDHIVPWDYVGDELENNLQALCSNCNERKSNRVALAVHNLFLNRKEYSYEKGKRIAGTAV